MSSRAKPAISSMTFKFLPAAHTKGSPCKSSFLPGASPISMTRACGFPTPNTVCVRPPASGHAWHAHTCSRIVSKGIWGLLISATLLVVFVSLFVICRPHQDLPMQAAVVTRSPRAFTARHPPAHAGNLRSPRQAPKIRVRVPQAHARPPQVRAPTRTGAACDGSAQWLSRAEWCRTPAPSSQW